MVHTTSMDEFVRINDKQIHYMVSKICVSYKVYNIEDIIQDIYLCIMDKKILERYNPNYNPKYPTKFSSYLYTVIHNFIKQRIYHSSYQNEKITSYSYEMEEIIDKGGFSTEYETIVERNNLSDNMLGLRADIDEFKNYLLKKNIIHKSRKNKKVVLYDIFLALEDGYTACDIAKRYGVTSMYITYMKHEISDIFNEFILK